MTPLSLNQFFDYRFLSGLAWSPGGKEAALTVTTACEEDNGYRQHLWLCREGTWLQLTGMGKEGSFLWEEEGVILFSATRLESDKRRAEQEEITPFYRISTKGGEALRAFVLPVAARGIRKISKGKFLITARCDANYPDYHRLSTGEREEIAKAKKEAEGYEILDEIPFWQNGAGFTNKLRHRLFLYEEETDSLTPITEPLFQTEHAVIVGDWIVYAGESYDRKPCRRADLWAYHTITGENRCLYSGREYNIQALEELEGQVVMIASDCRRYGINENPFFYLADPVTGSIRTLAETDLSIGSSVNSDCRYGSTRTAKADGGKLYFITTQRTASHLYSIDLAGKITPVLEHEGSIDDFDIQDGQLLLTAMWNMELQEIYRASPPSSKPEKISDFNGEALAGKYVAEPEHFTFQQNGVELDGWVLKPHGFDPSRSYPAILDIHGGPSTIYAPVFVQEMQHWAGQGYFVFFCNPEGSDGRGNEFADLRGKYGTKDYDALMTFTDRVLERYPQIDPKRLGVTGGSYGGFMTNWIIGHTQRFAAAASQRSIANWTSFYGNSDIGTFFGPDQMACDIYEGYEKLWWHSPLKYADRCATPTLFIHSDQDYRCWIPEGMQMYVALMDRGVEARMCWFKGENHELSRSGKSGHRVKRLEEITAWMDRHLENKPV